MNIFFPAIRDPGTWEGSQSLYGNARDFNRGFRGKTARLFRDRWTPGNPTWPGGLSREGARGMRGVYAF